MRKSSRILGRQMFFVFFLTVFLSMNTAVFADWVQDGGNLSTNGSRNAMEPSIAFYGSIPYVAYREEMAHQEWEIIIRHFTGSSWVTDTSNLNIDDNSWASNPKLGIYSSTFYVVWSEHAGTTYNVYMKSYSGTTWNQLGSNINSANYGLFPALTVASGTPYVAYVQGSSPRHVYVKRWTGSAWTGLGSALDADGVYGYASPGIAIYNNTPYVSYASGSPSLVVVKYWNGSSWVQRGSSLNTSGSNNAYKTDIQFYNSTPYVAWNEVYGTEENIFVKRWTGSTWSSLGSSLNVNVSQAASNPKLCFIGSTPFVSWYETSGTNQIYMKHWTGSAWAQDGGSANVVAGQIAGSNTMAIGNGTPYLTWAEVDTGYTQHKVYVKHYAFPTATFTRTRTASPTFTRTHSPTFTRTNTPEPGATSTYTATITPTSTRTPRILPTPSYTYTQTPGPTRVPDSERRLRIWHSKINPLKHEQARIRWYQFKHDKVDMVICNMLGDKIRTLANQTYFQPGGIREILWDGHNDKDEVVGSGVYFVFIQSGDYRDKNKIIVLK